MIQPITANQVIANRTRVANPYFAGKGGNKGADTPVECPDCKPMPTPSTRGEKLDINFEGCREYTLNGNKINYFA